MGERTQIEWCDHTFNPWQGCTRVTKGCEHCYAETLSRRFNSRNPLWGPRAPRLIASERAWREPLRWNRLAKDAGVRRRVFCASMGDVLERHADLEVNAVLDTARARLWDLIEATPHLDWLLLTKRPQHIGPMMPERWRNAVPSSVWFGASVCGEPRDAEMVRNLATWVHSLKASVGFLSYEPAVGAPAFLNTDGMGWVSWLIVGGESGPGARVFHADWAREVISYGKRCDVPVFVKQMGSSPLGLPLVCVWCEQERSDGDRCPECGDVVQIAAGERVAHLRDRKGGDPTEWPADLRVREVP